MNVFLFTGEHLDVCTSVAARNYQMSVLHPGSQHFAVSLPHPPTLSETVESLFSQFVSGKFVLSRSPSALNPNNLVLSVNHKTREVLFVKLLSASMLAQHWSDLVTFFNFSFQILSANEQACRLFECNASELIGKKLSCFLRKTSQVLEETVEEDFLLVDGAVEAVSGRVV